MKREINRFFLTLAIGVASALAIVSCGKDEEETESLPYLGGTLTFVADSYNYPGAQLNLTPKGAINPKGENIGYVWDFSWINQSDTTKFLTDGANKTGEISVTLPKEIGTYTVKCTAFADDFNPIQASKEIVVVKDELNVSITGTGIRPSNPHFVDERDGRTYYTATIGDLVWMRHNLAYAEYGKPYRESPAVSGIFGQYYLWEEAQKACPEGWRLPTNEDWANLGKEVTGNKELGLLDQWDGSAGAMMADAYFHDSKMWEYWPDVKITNESRFSAISSGYAIDESKTTFKIHTFATFWSADDFDEESAYYRYINASMPHVFLGQADKESFRATVRCVKDAK